jgi:hypothetical protein
MQNKEAFGIEFGREHGDAGDGAAGMGEARCEPGDDWIFADKGSDNRHGRGGMLHGSDRRPAHGDYRVGPRRGESTCEARQFLPWPGLDIQDEIVASANPSLANSGNISRRNRSTVPELGDRTPKW